MPTDLTPAERDDRESERLLNRKPAPSRKHRERRAPRHWQRRRRIREDDPDMRSSKLIDWTNPPSLRVDRPKTKTRSEELWEERTDDEIRDMERMVRELESLDGEDGAGGEDVRPEDFDALIDALSCDFATSYGADGGMSQRTGAYHGVRDVRGNPTDPPNTGWKSTDRRYFTEKDYDAIVRAASGLLKKDDWLAYGWDGGAEDAPLRAALDIAIQTVSDSVYQSKIDSETYDLLLNKLAKWGHDTFSDTVYPASRSAGQLMGSKMKQRQEYQDILKVASDLRKTDPVAALNIVKSLRALVSTDAAVAESISEHVAASGDASPQASADPRLAAAPHSALASLPVPVPFGVLARLAASSAEAKTALGSYLLAAKKGKEKEKGKEKDEKTAKGKVPPQFVKNMKKGPPKGKKKKASVVIASEDATW